MMTRENLSRDTKKPPKLAPDRKHSTL